MVVEVPLIKKYLINAIKGHIIGDSVDWMSYYGTPWLFWFFALLTSAKQYFGSPIQCFTPAEFGKSWENYAETYCFINHIYQPPLDYGYPNPSDRHDMVAYYRWVPLILLCQGCSFYLINILWEFLSKKSVINCEEIVKDAQTCSFKEKTRETKISIISQYIFDTFRYEFPKNGRFYNNGYCTAIFYLMVKFLNLINCCCNILLLENFLGSEISGFNYGFTALSNIFATSNGTTSAIKKYTHFPRVIMCDFNIRILANENNKTVQCVLMMNMINEKIFLFFYFWLWFVAITTFINLCYHFCIFFCPSYQTQFIFVHVSKKIRNEKSEEFIQSFLKPDGILLIKFIRQNAGGRVTADIVEEVFQKYRDLPIPVKEMPLSELEIEYKQMALPPALPMKVVYEETPKRKFLQDLPIISSSTIV